MTSPNDPPSGSSSHRPSSFDEWLQAAKEQATFFTGLKLDVGLPRGSEVDEELLAVAQAELQDRARRRQLVDGLSRLGAGDEVHLGHRPGWRTALTAPGSR